MHTTGSTSLITSKAFNAHIMNSQPTTLAFISRLEVFGSDLTTCSAKNCRPSGGGCPAISRRISDFLGLAVICRQEDPDHVHRHPLVSALASCFRISCFAFAGILAIHEEVQKQVKIRDQIT